jgi:acetyltransferase-like isoleucine patch superfamily enzyme
MDVSDMHSVYGIENAERINPSAPVVLGKHVWVGYGVILLRGTKIPSGSILGAGSVVKGQFDEINSVIAGSPRRIVRRGVRWDRRLPTASGNISG